METNDLNNIPKISDLRLLEIDTDAEWKRFKDEAGIKEPKVFRLAAALKAAAAVVLIAGASLLAYNSLSKPHQETYAAQSQMVEATVEKSTHISINKNSQIVCTDETDGIYNVKLKGEAYFDVEKNPKRSFQIETEDVTVIVHGTSFDICEEESQTVVTVTSGNVEVRNNKSGEAITDITKNKQLVCKKNGEMQVSEISNLNNIAWKLKQFKFENSKISDVIAQLSKVYDFKYTFASNDIKNATLTGSFDNQNIQSIFNVLEQTLDIKIEKTGNGEIKIGRQ